MNLKRREFLKLGAAATAGLMLPRLPFEPGSSSAFAFSQSANLAKFIQPLRGVGGAGIPVAVKDAVEQPWWQPDVDHYTIDIGQFTDQLHPALPIPRAFGASVRALPAASNILAALSLLKEGPPFKSPSATIYRRTILSPLTARSWVLTER